LTQEQFNDLVNDPDLYQVQAKKPNESHLFEMEDEEKL